MIAAKAIERDGKVVIITEMDVAAVQAYLSDPAIQADMRQQLVSGIVDAFLMEKHEALVGAINPHLIVRMAQATLAAQMLQHVRSGVPLA